LTSITPNLEPKIIMRSITNTHSISPNALLEILKAGEPMFLPH